MFLLMLISFLQSQRASTYNETTPGTVMLFKRGSDQLSWIEAREACDSMSYSILPGMRAARALGLLHVGEIAWIDGKQYSFCHALNVMEREERCIYVMVRREDAKENLMYNCDFVRQSEKNEEMVPYADAERKCSASLPVVGNFGLPLFVPVNRTYWIKDYIANSITSRLRPAEKVTEICIGIVKLDRDKFEFGTTSCDENHVVICDASGVSTALTITTREKMMPRLSNLEARTSSYQPQAYDTIPKLFSLGSIFGLISFPLVIGAILIFAIMKCHKCRRQCQETLSLDNTMQEDAGSAGYVVVL